MHHTLWRPITTVALAFTLLACSDPGQSLDTIAPTVPTAATPTTAATTTTDSTTTTVMVVVVDTTVVDTTTVPTADTLALTDGPWTVVDSIPEVTEPGLYYELSLPGLYAYFPEKINDDDPVFWTINEADRPIIEAYLNAQLTLQQSKTTRPMDFNLSGWDRYFEDGGEELKSRLQARSDSGLALDTDLGIVLRPWVIDDQRTETSALVVDCITDGSVLVDAGGALGEGSARGWGQSPNVAEMALVSGSWKLVSLSRWEDACALYGP